MPLRRGTHPCAHRPRVAHAVVAGVSTKYGGASAAAAAAALGAAVSTQKCVPGFSRAGRREGVDRWARRPKGIHCRHPTSVLVVPFAVHNRATASVLRHCFVVLWRACGSGQASGSTQAAKGDRQIGNLGDWIHHGVAHRVGAARQLRLVPGTPACAELCKTRWSPPVIQLSYPWAAES